MNMRRMELFLMFVVVLALNGLGTMWWLSSHSVATAQASEQEQAEAQGLETALAAPIPRTFGYQGTLRLADGSLANGNFNLTFKLYNVAGGGDALYSETINNVVARDGLFSVVIGGNSEVPASVFDNTPLYLGIAVAPDPEMVPRQRLYPVPWAMQATAAAVANGLTPGASMSGVLTLGSGGKVIAFARDGGDDADAGKIAYKADWDATALSITGAGASGARKIHLYDDVTVEKDLAVSGNLTLNSDFAVNAIREIGDSKGNPITREYYPVSTRRYVLEAKDAGDKPSSVPVDDAILTELCQDEDGCKVTLAMRDWNPAHGRGLLATKGPFMFSLSQNKGNGSRDWTIHQQGIPRDDDPVGVLFTDGNSETNHVIIIPGGCFFTDGQHSNGDHVGDSGRGFYLINWFGRFDSADMVCVLIIED